jgi:hypothetical protein
LAEKEMIKEEEERQIQIQSSIAKREIVNNRIMEWRRQRLVEMKIMAEQRAIEMQTAIEDEMKLEQIKEKKREYTKSLLESYHAELVKKREEELEIRKELQCKQMQEKHELNMVQEWLMIVQQG